MAKDRKRQEGKPEKHRPVRPNPGLTKASREAVRRDQAAKMITCPVCGEVGVMGDATAESADWFCLACRAGGKKGNTPPATIPVGPPDVGDKRCGGVDYLALSLYGDFDSAWEGLKEDLEQCQRFAREGDDERRFLEVRDDITIEVSPGGAGKGFAFCPYIVKAGGMVVRITNRQSSAVVNGQEQERPNVYVEMPSLMLMQRGEAGAVDDMQRLLRALGYSVRRVTVSRVDIAADLVGISMKDVVGDFLAGKLVRRTRKWSMYGEGPNTETLYLGAGAADIMCRIYDKVAATKDDGTKWNVMVEKRWGGVEPAAAVRVEFQLRREALRNLHCIESLDDLWNKLKDVADWCCLSWLRFTENVPNKTNTASAKISGWWRKVMDGFRSWTGVARKRRSKRTKLVPDVKKLFRQAEGCMTSALAAMGQCGADALSMVSMLFEFVAKRGANTKNEIRAKRLEWEAAVPDIPGLWRLGLVE